MPTGWLVEGKSVGVLRSGGLVKRWRLAVAVMVVPGWRGWEMSLRVRVVSIQPRAPSQAWKNLSGGGAGFQLERDRIARANYRKLRTDPSDARELVGVGVGVRGFVADQFHEPLGRAAFDFEDEF
jgi:hypothetical protein